MKYSEIYDYWKANPCTGGNPAYPFFLFKNRKVLEIGCGTGVDAIKFMKAGADYTGIDLMSILFAKPEFSKYKGRFFQMNAEYLDFPDNYFDLVYSWGVIHHAINPKNIMNEAYRVLKPKGHIAIMVYGKPSFRYFEIMVLRKILWYLRYPKYDKLRGENPHPTKEQWISWNTDNLGCPLARVYTKNEAKKLLGRFMLAKTWTEKKGWFRILMGRKG